MTVLCLVSSSRDNSLVMSICSYNSCLFLSQSHNSQAYLYMLLLCERKFEDVKGVIRRCTSTKGRQYNGNDKNGQTMIYKTDTEN